MKKKIMLLSMLGVITSPCFSAKTNHAPAPMRDYFYAPDKYTYVVPDVNQKNNEDHNIYRHGEHILNVLSPDKLRDEANQNNIKINTWVENYKQGKSPNDEYPVSHGKGSMAHGLFSRSGGYQSMAIGQSAESGGSDSVALGPHALAGSFRATAVGPAAIANGDLSLAVGVNSTATQQDATAIGVLSQANGSYSSAVGTASKASGEKAAAMGLFSEASGNASSAVGARAQASGVQSAALGYLAQAKSESSVALGGGSISDRVNSGAGVIKELFSDDVLNKHGEVSVGRNTFIRQITHVAGGTEDTDAVNVRQLRAVNTTVSRQNKLINQSYDDTIHIGSDLGGNIVSVTGNQGDRIITGIAEGIKDNDAINVSQLNTVKKNATIAYTLAQQHNSLLHEIKTDLYQTNVQMSRGLASAAALTGLFQPYGIGKCNLTASLGGYGLSPAIAVGTGYRITENIAIKTGIAYAAGDNNVTYNASVNLEW